MVEKNVIKKRVRELLEKYPETRDDDRLLMVKYWNEFDGIPFDHTFAMNFITRATSPETIRRSRQYIQAQGFFLPTEETVLVRRRREAEMREEFRQA
jgi:hypothetical protein